MKIALLNPFLPYKTINKRRHLGLAYLAASLREKYHKVIIIDSQLYELSLDEMVKKTIEFSPDLVGISILPASFDIAKKIAQEIQDCIHPKPLIVAGNYLATNSPEVLLQEIPQIDFAIIGEGELPIVSLCEYLKGKISFDAIPNIFGKNHNNTKTIIARTNLANLPMPAEDDLNYAINNSIPPGVMDITTSRGCNNNCSFCESPRFYKTSRGESSKERYRRRPVDKVVAEISHYYKNYRINGFDIIDDDFLGDGEDYAIEFAKLIKKENLQINFWFATRADKVNEKLFSYLKSCGLSWVFIGVESFVEEQLKRYNKGTSVITNLNAINLLKKLKIDFRIGFIPMDPFIDLEDLATNLSYIDKLDIYDAIATPTREVRLYSNSPLTQKANKFGLLLKKKKSDLTYNYKFQDQRVGKIYDESARWYAKTYKCMMFLREIRDCTKTMEGSKLVGTIKHYFYLIKKLEFDHIQNIVEQKPENHESYLILKEHLIKWNDYCLKNNFNNLIFSNLEDLSIGNRTNS